MKVFVGNIPHNYSNPYKLQIKKIGRYWHLVWRGQEIMCASHFDMIVASIQREIDINRRFNAFEIR